MLLLHITHIGPRYFNNDDLLNGNPHNAIGMIGGQLMQIMQPFEMSDATGWYPINTGPAEARHCFILDAIGIDGLPAKLHTHKDGEALSLPGNIIPEGRGVLAQLQVKAEDHHRVLIVEDTSLFGSRWERNFISWLDKQLPNLGLANVTVIIHPRERFFGSPKAEALIPVDTGLKSVTVLRATQSLFQQEYGPTPIDPMASYAAQSTSAELNVPFGEAVSPPPSVIPIFGITRMQSLVALKIAELTGLHDVLLAERRRAADATLEGRREGLIFKLDK